jgi:dCTP deaminase
MIVGPTTLNHAIEMHGLVMPRPEKAIDTDSVDLRIGEVMKHCGGAVLDDNREIGDLEALAPENGYWILEPNTNYLIRTIEKVRLPVNHAAFLVGRSTMMRSGIIITTTFVDPGYDGSVHFGILTPGPRKTKIKVGLQAVQMVFLLAEAVVPYNGAYQGGKTRPSPLVED